MKALLLLLALYPWLQTCQAKPKPWHTPWLLGHYPIYNYADYGAYLDYNRQFPPNSPQSYGVNGPGVSRPIVI